MTDSALFRLSRTDLSQSPEFTSTQASADHIVTTFGEEATRGRTLASIVVGGSLYRFANIGSTALLGTRVSAPVAQVLSTGTALFSEAAGFQLTDRAWRVGLEGADASILRAGGERGLVRGTLESVGTFGALRGAGWATRGHNIVVQHTSQAFAMVGAHHMTAWAGWSETPEGSIAEQLAHAEIMNLQVMFGMGAFHEVAPGIAAFERSMDLATQARAENTRRAREGRMTNPFAPELAADGVPGRIRPENAEPLSGLRALMSLMQPGENGGETRSNAPSGERAPARDTNSSSEALGALRDILARYSEAPSGEGIRERKRNLRQARDGMKDQVRQQLGDLVKHFQEHPESLREVLATIESSSQRGEIDQAVSQVIRELQNPNRPAEVNARVAQQVLERMPLSQETFMTWRHLIPNGMTLAAATLAAISIGMSTKGHFDTAALLLPIAAILDVSDGGVARALRASHPIGARLDSYADLTAYGMASAFFARAVLESQGESTLGTTAAAVIFSHALLRLAVFDFLGDNTRVLPTHDVLGNPVRPERSDFMGMPSTMVGVYIPALYLLFGRSNPEAFAAGATLVGSAMLWPFRYVKFGKLFRNMRNEADNPSRPMMTLVGILGPIGAAAVYSGIQGDARHMTLGVVAGAMSYMVSPIFERAALALNRWRQRRRSAGDSSRDPSLPPPTGAVAPLPPSESEGSGNSGREGGETPLPSHESPGNGASRSSGADVGLVPLATALRERIQSALAEAPQDVRPSQDLMGRIENAMGEFVRSDRGRGGIYEKSNLERGAVILAMVDVMMRDISTTPLRDLSRMFDFLSDSCESGMKFLNEPSFNEHPSVRQIIPHLRQALVDRLLRDYRQDNAVATTHSFIRLAGRTFGILKDEGGSAIPSNEMRGHIPLMIRALEYLQENPASSSVDFIRNFYTDRNPQR